MKPMKGKKKVLIIDDDPHFSALVNSVLEFHKEYEVCVQNDSRLAVATARKFGPDIVILDVVMPEVDGGEVHMRFKADPALRDIPIIFLTSLVQQNEIDEHQGIIGGSRYIAKPVSANVLVSAIAEHFHS